MKIVPAPVLVTAVVVFVCTLHLPAAPAVAGELSLRAARPPSAAERRHMERWHRAWTDEAAPVARAFASLARLARRRGNPDLRPRCLELSRALLDLDRERVLPAPDPAADLHLRAGLRELTRAAVTCLTKRPYAARHALGEAEARFRQVDLVLGAYDLEPKPFGPGRAGGRERSRSSGLAPSLQ